MELNQLQDEILGIIRTVFTDKSALQKIHTFLIDEIYEEPEPEEIPVKYRKAVSKIAENLICGLICYFNPDTLEIEEIPEFMSDTDEYELISGEPADGINLQHQKWERCIEIVAMESRESFKVMEYFIDVVDDKNLQNKLINALNRKRPFANFKHIIEFSDYRQQWFDFRQKQYEYYAWDSISMEIEIEKPSNE